MINNDSHKQITPSKKEKKRKENKNNEEKKRRQHMKIRRIVEKWERRKEKPC